MSSRAASSDKWKADAKCPFFRNESFQRHAVFCDGCENDQKLQISFRTEKKRQAWLRNMCSSWAYVSCPYYRALMDDFDMQQEK